MDFDPRQCSLLVLLLVCVMSGLVSAQSILAISREVSRNSHAPHAHHAHYRTVCYLEGWAHYRPDPVQFHPEDVDTSLCTHIIFAFAGLDKSGIQVIADDPNDLEMYRRVTDLKREKPSLKVMLAVGGWKMGSDEFTLTVSSTGNMHAFAANVIEYLHRYNFDGLDLDWEYPADRGSPPGDKQRFTNLVQILAKDFRHDHANTNRTKLLLSLAISPTPAHVSKSYELEEIAKQVDFINALTYDLHGSWDTMVGHHSSLYSSTNDETDSIDYLISWVLNTTVPRQKINLGLSFYGRSMNLTNPSSTAVGSGTTGGGAPGPYTGETGFLAYYEVCKILTDHADTVTDSGRLPGTQAPYVVDGSRWTGYDDAQSIKEKVAYAMQNGLGGVFIWSITMDDFHGICGGGHYPLMNAIKQQFHQAIIG